MFFRRQKGEYRESDRVTRYKLIKSGKHWLRASTSLFGLFKVLRGGVDTTQVMTEVVEDKVNPSITGLDIIKGLAATGAVLGGAVATQTKVFANETVAVEKTLENPDLLVTNDTVVLGTTSLSNSENSASLSTSTSESASMSESVSKSSSASASASTSASASASASTSASVSTSTSISQSTSEPGSFSTASSLSVEQSTSATATEQDSSVSTESTGLKIDSALLKATEIDGKVSASAAQSTSAATSVVGVTAGAIATAEVSAKQQDDNRKKLTKLSAEMGEYLAKAVGLPNTDSAITKVNAAVTEIEKALADPTSDLTAVVQKATQARNSIANAVLRANSGARDARNGKAMLRDSSLRASWAPEQGGGRMTVSSPDATFDKATGIATYTMNVQANSALSNVGVKINVGQGGHVQSATFNGNSMEKTYTEGSEIVYNYRHGQNRNLSGRIEVKVKYDNNVPTATADMQVQVSSAPIGKNTSGNASAVQHGSVATGYNASRPTPPPSVGKSGPIIQNNNGTHFDVYNDDYFVHNLPILKNGASIRQYGIIKQDAIPGVTYGGQLMGQEINRPNPRYNPYVASTGSPWLNQKEEIKNIGTGISGTVGNGEASAEVGKTYSYSIGALDWGNKSSQTTITYTVKGFNERHDVQSGDVVQVKDLEHLTQQEIAEVYNNFINNDANKRDLLTNRDLTKDVSKSNLTSGANGTVLTFPGTKAKIEVSTNGTITVTYRDGTTSTINATLEKYNPIAKVPKVYTYVGEQASDLGTASNFIQRANGEAFPAGTRITWKQGAGITNDGTGSKQAIAHIDYPNGGSEDVTVNYEVLSTIKSKGPVNDIQGTPPHNGTLWHNYVDKEGTAGYPSGASQAWSKDGQVVSGSPINTNEAGRHNYQVTFTYPVGRMGENDPNKLSHTVDVVHDVYKFGSNRSYTFTQNKTDEPAYKQAVANPNEVVNKFVGSPDFNAARTNYNWVGGAPSLATVGTFTKEVEVELPADSTGVRVKQKVPVTVRVNPQAPEIADDSVTEKGGLPNRQIVVNNVTPGATVTLTIGTQTFTKQSTGTSVTFEPSELKRATDANNGLLPTGNVTVKQEKVVTTPAGGKETLTSDTTTKTITKENVAPNPEFEIYVKNDKTKKWEKLSPKNNVRPGTSGYEIFAGDEVKVVLKGSDNSGKLRDLKLYDGVSDKDRIFSGDYSSNDSAPGFKNKPTNAPAALEYTATYNPNQKYADTNKWNLGTKVVDLSDNEARTPTVVVAQGKLNVRFPGVKPSRVFQVKHPNALDQREKDEILAAVKTANPETANRISSYSIAENGTVTITYKDGTVNTVTPDISDSDYRASVSASTSVSQSASASASTSAVASASASTSAVASASASTSAVASASASTSAVASASASTSAVASASASTSAVASASASTSAVASASASTSAVASASASTSAVASASASTSAVASASASTSAVASASASTSAVASASASTSAVASASASTSAVASASASTSAVASASASTSAVASASASTSAVASASASTSAVASASASTSAVASASASTSAVASTSASTSAVASASASTSAVASASASTSAVASASASTSAVASASASTSAVASASASTSAVASASASTSAVASASASTSAVASASASTSAVASASASTSAVASASASTSAVASASASTSAVASASASTSAVASASASTSAVASASASTSAVASASASTSAVASASASTSAVASASASTSAVASASASTSAVASASASTSAVASASASTSAVASASAAVSTSVSNSASTSTSISVSNSANHSNSQVGNTSESTGKSQKELPNTGTESSTGSVLLGALAALTGIGLVVKRRKRDEEE